MIFQVENALQWPCKPFIIIQVQVMKHVFTRTHVRGYMKLALIFQNVMNILFSGL